MSKCKLQPKLNLLSKEKQKPPSFLLFDGKMCKTKTVNENSESDCTKKKKKECKCKFEGKKYMCTSFSTRK